MRNIPAGTPRPAETEGRPRRRRVAADADKPATSPRATLWTPAELSAALREVSEKTLANWRSSGYGPPYVKVGTAVLYRQSSVERWLEQNEKLSGEAA